MNLKWLAAAPAPSQTHSSDTRAGIFVCHACANRGVGASEMCSRDIGHTYIYIYILQSFIRQRPDVL